MNISNEQIKSVLKTLPIGYYLGQNIDIEVSDSEPTSFFSPDKFKIVISTSIIQKGLVNCNEQDNIETIIRSMLYHEISHVILTPTDIKSFPYYLNVFEDERIETRLKDYYLNVDFKWTVKTICKDAFNSTPTTADEYWFSLCRFRKGSPEHLKELDYLLTFFKLMDRFSSSQQCDYEYRIKLFYESVKKDFLENQLNNLPSLATSGEQDKDSPELRLDDSDQENSEFEKSLSDHEAIKQTVTNIVDEMVEDVFSKSQLEELKEIFIQMNKKKGRYGGNIQAYSGTFNYRQVTRQDCKFFVQTNRQERSSVISKTKLNLFIDGSSSYRDNLKETNRILRCLERLEKETSDFEFDLISIFYDDPVLQKKSNRKHDAHGFSLLGTKAKEIYQQVQDKTARNINILLLDGMFDDIYSSNFSIFNQKNVIIISDSTNKRYLENTCKQAMKTFLETSNRSYASQLFRQIADSLRKQISLL